MLERIKHEKTVDIYGHVTLMRSQRNYMVQTEDQYSFIHDALLEAVACGNTEVAARSLYSYIQKLAQVESGEHVTGMELEFKVLNALMNILATSCMHCKWLGSLFVVLILLWRKNWLKKCRQAVWTFQIHLFIHLFVGLIY